MKPIWLMTFIFFVMFQDKTAIAASCLDDVANFAIRICGYIANSGTSTVVDANGNVDASISDIIKNVVGGASTSINGHVLYDTYVGVARNQLAGVHFSDIDCRQKMVNIAVAQVCQTRPSAPSPVRRSVIRVSTLNYTKAENIAPASGKTAAYGDVILNAPPYTSRHNAAEWTVYALQTGAYELEIEYATADSRPVRILVNGVMWRQSALNAVTGGFTLSSQRSIDVGRLVLNQGDNIIRIERDDVFPHIRTLLFRPVN